MNMASPCNITSSVSLVIARWCAACMTASARCICRNMLAEGFTADEVHAGITVYEAVGCEDPPRAMQGRAGIYHDADDRANQQRAGRW